MHRVFGTRVEHADYYHRPGAYVIPYRDGKIAVVKIPKGYFLLGGGKEKIASGKKTDDVKAPAGLEDDLTCIRRECLEEIGYAVSPGHFICSAETFCEIPEKGFFHPIQTYYQCELLEKMQDPIEKDHQLVWMEPREAIDKLFVEQQRWAVEVYTQSLQRQTAQPLQKLSEPQRAAELFNGWQETIIWSCLQSVMGSVYADRQDAPRSAAAVLGDFCFLAGRPSREFLDALSKGVRRDFIIMVPQDGLWGDLIETSFGDDARKITRLATKKDTAFDQKKLRELAEAIPAGMELRELDQDPEIFQLAKTTSWCEDWVSQYETYEDYRERGIGVVLMEAGALVSGASSYSSYNGGIEIEIDTRADCRRQGFARICGAALILRCLREGLYPSWDAHNEGSLALAEQLGYAFDRAYTAYEVRLQEGRCVSMTETEQMQVRRARPEDMDAIMALQVATFNGEQEIPAELIQLPEERETQWWAAFCGQTLMGAVASWQEDGVQHAGRFAVNPDSRGQGIGKKLAQKAFDDLFGQGVTEIYMEARDVSVHIVQAMGGEVTGPAFAFYRGTVTPMKLVRENYVGQTESEANQYE